MSSNYFQSVVSITHPKRDVVSEDIVQGCGTKLTQKKDLELNTMSLLTKYCAIAAIIVQQNTVQPHFSKNLWAKKDSLSIVNSVAMHEAQLS